MPKLFRRYWRNVLGVCLSLFLTLGSLYQLEIATICAFEGRLFDWPFYLLPSINAWFARDLFYLGILAGWITLFAALWWWE